jgi:hypothetical protein
MRGVRERPGLRCGGPVLAVHLCRMRHERRLPRGGDLLHLPRVSLTMSHTIAVELPAADVASPSAQALLDTCTAGTQARARCMLSADAAAEGDRIAVAIVTWDGPARTGAHVEVGLRVGVEQRWRARELSFSRVDPDVERWRTVGFAIATLVGDLIEHDQASPERGPTPAPAAIPPRREAPQAEGARDTSTATWLPAAWLDAVLSVDTGAAAAPAFGAEIRLAHMLDRERWFVAGAVQCGAQWLQEDRLSIVRPAASAGVGVVALQLGQRLRFTLRVEAMMQLVRVAGTDPESGASAQGGRWLPGLEQGLDGAWMASRRVGLVAGARVAEAAGAVDIMAHGQLVARIPAVDWVGEGGMRIAFP